MTPLRGTLSEPRLLCYAVTCDCGELEDRFSAIEDAEDRGHRHRVYTGCRYRITAYYSDGTAVPVD